MSDPVSFFEEKNKAYCMCYRETGGKMVKISKGNTHEREKNLSESNYIDVNITNAEKGNNEGQRYEFEKITKIKQFYSVLEDYTNILERKSKSLNSGVGGVIIRK